MATLSSLSLEIMLEFGNDTKFPQNVTRVASLANDAWKDLCREFEWPWLRTSEQMSTVAGTQEYSLATTCAEVVAARFAGSIDQQLTYTPVEFLQGVDLELQARPERFFNSGYDSSTSKNKIKLWPKPDAIYTLELWEVIRPSTLTASTTIPVPEEFIPVLKHRLRFLVMQNAKDFASADRWAKVYDAELARSIARYSSQKSEMKNMQYNDVPNERPQLARLPNSYGRTW